MEKQKTNTAECCKDNIPDLTQANHSQYYKNKCRTMESGLQQRRETFMNEHKEKHNAVYDDQRDLSDLFEEIEVSMEDAEIGNEAMDVENTGKEFKRSQRKKTIKFKMTLSEWFTDIPEDLSDKWLVKFCPEGKRRLVVANRKITKAFSKFGRFTSHFLSNLPGGGNMGKYKTERSGLTVLDCVFHEKSKTYFVLDMLVWNSVPFLDCEAQLRHYWINAKYLECPDSFTACESFKFIVLADFQADRDTIESQMYKHSSEYPWTCEGLLFYHKEIPYIMGENPMVTWLRPFMLPEKLHVNIPPEYATKKPSNYLDMQSYLKQISGNKMKKKRGRKNKYNEDSIEMETEMISA